MLGSLALHVSIGVILAAVLVHAHDPVPKNVVVTKLVRLGKKRPDDMLPRLLKEKPPAPAAHRLCLLRAPLLLRHPQAVYAPALSPP